MLRPFSESPNPFPNPLIPSATYFVSTLPSEIPLIPGPSPHARGEGSTDSKVHP
jgi:hypothetical protein